MASIDGSCLTEITNDDLENDLEIKSTILRKKLIAWFSSGLNQYETFILNSSKC